MEYNNDKIDEILSELKSDRSKSGTPAGDEVDKILSSLKMPTASVDETAALAGEKKTTQENPVSDSRGAMLREKYLPNADLAGDKRERAPEKKAVSHPKRPDPGADAVRETDVGKKQEKKPASEAEYIQPNPAPLQDEGEFVRPSPDIFSGERLDRLNKRAEEMIDDRFYEFFTHSVVVDQAELDRRMKEERRRKKKERRGFSLFGRRGSRQEEMEQDEPVQAEPVPEEGLPQDIFASAPQPSARTEQTALDPDVFEKAKEQRERAAARLSKLAKGPQLDPAEEKSAGPQRNTPLTQQPDKGADSARQEPVRTVQHTSAAPAPSETEKKEARQQESFAERTAPQETPLKADALLEASSGPTGPLTESEQAAPAEEEHSHAVSEASIDRAETVRETAPSPKPDGAPAEQAEGQEQETPAPELQTQQDEKKERFDPLGISGHPADETEEDTTEFEPAEAEQAQEEEEPIEDYDSPSDAPAVQEDLRSLRTSLNLRLIVTLLLGVLGLYLSLTTGSSGLPSLPILDPKSQPLFFLGANAVLLLIAMVVNYNTIASGISSLWSSPSTDLLASLSSIAALIQCGVMMTDPQQFSSSGYTLFSGVAILCLAGNTFGKCITARMVSENFEMASAGFDHAAAYQITDPELLKKVTSGLGEPQPHLLVSRPTALVRGFLRQSFSEHRSDRTVKWLGIAALAGGIGCMAIAAIFTKNLYTAVSCFAGALALAAPLSSTLVGAIPAGLMQSSAARVGAVVPGPSAVENLRSTNVVLVGARDLFPPATVRLRGIKTFQKERIDLAILYAASILVEGCDTLRDIFLGVVEGKRDMLFPVENLVTEIGFGFMGWIDNNRVIIGNREMMTRHGIEIPSMDYERRYTGEDKLPIYLAVSGRLFGMFLVSYGPDEEMAETVEELRRAGISLLVRSTDFNVTRDLIADCYGISPDSVKVLNAEELAALSPSLAYLPESDGVMTHIGSFASFIGGLRAATAASGAEKAASVLQAVSVVLGLVLGLLLAVTTGLGSLSALAILLYHCAWLILIVAVPLLRRY